MVSRMLKKSGSERGFSLISFIVALAIGSVLAGGVTMIIFQLSSVSSSSVDHLMAIRDVQNAGRWICRDGQMAADIELTADADGFPLTLTWTDRDGDEHEAVYSLLAGNEMQREYYTNRTLNADPDTTSVVAMYIDDSATSCNLTETDELIVKITSATGSGAKNYAETRTYRVSSRLN
jgi:Tfp pilus assembly protein PilW